MVTGSNEDGRFVEFPREEILGSIPDRFNRQVERTPDRPAVQTHGLRLTYSELNLAANRIAWAVLSERGDLEEPVSLLLDAAPAVPAAILGALKAGKFWVPLDPSHPHARNESILEDSGARLILTDEKNLPLAETFTKTGVRVLRVDAAGETGRKDNPSLHLNPDRIAHLLYTSGTTGRPKGVIQTHRNVLHSIRCHTNRLRISGGDRLSLLSSYTHQAGQTDIFRALLNGALLLPFDLRREPIERLAEWLREEGITLYHSVPTVFRHFLTCLRDGAGFPQVRLIHLGGEPLTRHDVELYRRHFGDDCVLLNNLGSTETSTYRQFFITKDTVFEGNTVPAGEPVEDKELLLLDETGRPTAMGETGEIAIRSRYIAPGYWNRPDLTRQVFIPNAEDSTLQTYRTGDLGRLLSDGRLLYLGRKDLQMKFRGQRVETGEIECAFHGMPSIRQAAIVPVPRANGEIELSAFLVAKPGCKPTNAELRQSLRSMLPDFMIPSHFIFLDTLPLTPNGKVNRKALAGMSHLQPDLPAGKVLPRTPLEEDLKDIWESVLSLSLIGIHDDFFELGGNSLLAVQIVSRIRALLGNDISLNDIFISPTIAGLAGQIAGNGDAGDTPRPTESLPRKPRQLKRRSNPPTSTSVEPSGLHQLSRDGS